MKKRGIEIPAMQETKVNTNSREDRENYVWYFSTGVKDSDRNKYNKLKDSGKRIPPAVINKIREHRRDRICHLTKTTRHRRKHTSNR
eukprot:1507622-Karenia_brevis.AAC.1